MESGFSAREESGKFYSDQYLKECRRQLLHWPASCYLLPSFKMRETPLLSLRFVASKTKKLMHFERRGVVSLAKKAFSTSKRAASLAVSNKSYEATLNEFSTPSGESTNLADLPVEKEKIVRSTHPSKRNGVANRTHLRSTPLSKWRGMPNGKTESELLSSKEEYELIVDIQRLIRLEKVESRLRTQLGREPALVEWAKAVGLSSHALNLQLHRGYRSKEKLIYAHFGVVVHIAQQYQGLGLHIDDLLQDGCKGLMKGVEKFNRKVGCRLVTYAYYWIKNSVRDAFFRNSRIIRLPGPVHILLSQVAEAKRSCVQDGIHHPTNEDIATRVGITIEKLEELYLLSRKPVVVSPQQMESFSDPEDECSIVSVEKQFMRQHVRNLLNMLTHNERRIMRLRYGLEGGQPKRLADIGDVFGLSKQRVQQLESRAMNKLRQCVGSQELETYKDLLI